MTPTVTSVDQGRAWRRNRSRILQYITLTALAVIIIVPIVILIFGSLKTRGEMYSRPYTVPSPPHWENYIKILTSGSYWIMLRNSLVVMVAVTAGVVFLSSLAAFVLSRMEFRGKNVTFNFLTLGVMFPLTLAILPEQHSPPLPVIVSTDLPARFIWPSANPRAPPLA